MVKPISKSQALGSKVMFAALCLLRDKGCAIKAGEILEVLEHQLLLDDWARETIESTGADLVVMGSHGRRGLEKFMLGSVTQRVLGAVKVPVMVVRD